MDKSPSRNVLGGALWINLANTVRMREHRVTDMLEEPGYLDEWLHDNELHGLNNTPGAASAVTREDLLPELLRLRGVCRHVLEDLDPWWYPCRIEAFAAMEAEASRLDVALRAERDAQGTPPSHHLRAKRRPRRAVPHRPLPVRDAGKRIFGPHPDLRA
ncbi:hypothetical protein CPT76_32110 [Paenibacillus sp. AR247]|nr:hypothetical protein CPT76_32110 [Paenibacillus sp. AR247]